MGGSRLVGERFVRGACGDVCAVGMGTHSLEEGVGSGELAMTCQVETTVCALGMRAGLAWDAHVYAQLR
eukprot:3147261-Pleurochrysis_carterae.AAC.1